MKNTRESLLKRVRDPGDGAAWEEFFVQYAGPIQRYARKLGLDCAAAADVLQETMVELIRILPSFAYDTRRGRFRNFVLTITHRRILTAWRRERTRENTLHAFAADANERMHAPIGGRWNNDSAPNAEAMQKWREEVLAEAVRRLKSDPQYGEQSILVFQAHVVEGQSAQEVARAYGTTPNNVYQVKNRLVRRLRGIATALMEEIGELD